MMRITALRFADFRNYERLELEGVEGLVIFCGHNAVGKTNILEGIHLLTTASSFRHPQINQLIRQGSNQSRIEIMMSDGNRQIQTALTLEPGKKRYTVNGKTRQSADVRGMLPAVTFVPDDLELAKKSSAAKRSALDDLGVQLSKNYSIVRKDYEKTLRYKNKLLKDESPQPLIDAINETLLEVGSQLYCYRRSLYERIVPVVRQNYARLVQTDEQFSATYLPSWLRAAQRYSSSAFFDEETATETSRDKVKELIYKGIEAFSSEERRAHRALVGPHNDQITFFLNEGDASNFASQGQQRSIVLAWKLAEVETIRQSLGVNPVLLLDDVMSELDETRRAHLVNFVSEDIQTFITTTDLTPFDPTLLEKAQVIHLPL